MLLSVGLAIVAGYLVLSINVYLESQVLSNVQATGAVSIDAGILAAAIAQALALHAQAAQAPAA